MDTITPTAPDETALTNEQWAAKHLPGAVWVLTELNAAARVATDRDADLMRSLAWNRYLHPGCREFWRRAFVGLAYDDLEHGTIDMGPDERAFRVRHEGSNRAWSGD